LIARLTKDIKDQEAAGIAFYDAASALFGVAGLRVTDAGTGPGDMVEVRAVTDLPGSAYCPECGTECGTESSRVHKLAVACPRDVRRRDDPVELRWVKRRLKCGNAACPRKTFTERIPAVPPGCRVTARHSGVFWPIAHGAFATRVTRC
jgi:hypothetical protein